MKRNTTYRTMILSFLSASAFIFSGALLAEDAQTAASPGFVLDLLGLNHDLSCKTRPAYLSPCALAVSPDEATLYIAYEGVKQVGIFDVASEARTSAILLPNNPTGLVLSADGAALYVTCSSERWPMGMVYKINTQTKSIEVTIPVGHSACAPTLSPDEKWLFTCNAFENNVSMVDLGQRKQIAKIDVMREPHDAVVSQDGKTLLVNNSLPVGKAAFDDEDTIAACVSFVDIDQKQEVARVQLPDGSHSLNGICLTPDGTIAVVTHVLGRYKLPANIIERGWINSNSISVIDVKERQMVNVVALDESSHGVANPWDVVITEDGKTMCVSHAGSAELTFVDVPAMLAKLAATTTDLTRDLTFALDFKTRISLKVRSPRALAVAGDQIIVAGYHSDELAFSSLNNPRSSAVKKIALTDLPSTRERDGSFHFYDAKICFQQWQSCNSCHPFTRPDMLNWDLQKDGIGNPRNAKSMLWAHRTPRAHADGGRIDAATAVRAGISFEQFTTPDEDRATSIDTFLHYMKPYPSPHLENGMLSEKAQKGKVLYLSKKTDCAICHPAPLYTDQKLHVVGTGADPTNGNEDWDSPTLVESWRTSPYGHEGQYATMTDILKVKGHTSAHKLSQEEFEALIEYVLSL